MPARRLTRARTSVKPPSPPKSGRPTRRAAVAATTAIIENERGSIKLHVKASPSKLREVTGGANRPTRGTRRRAIVEESSSEEEEDDEEDAEGEDDDEEMADAEEDDLDEDEDDEDAEGDEDEDMEDAPPPPKPRASVPKHVSKPPPAPKSTAPSQKASKATAVPAMKATEDSDDDELSSLGSLDEDEEDAEGEEADEDMDETNVNMGEDGEEDEDEDGEGEEDEDMGEVDSDGTPIWGGETQDLSRLTRRQRAVHELEDFEEGLVSLSNEAQKKKHLTAEEHAMRRAEMARRRKTLSEKRNEEEKLDTINRLLKRQAPKRQKKDEKDENDADGRAPVSFVRMISTVEGTRLAIPDQWLEAPVGNIFKQSQKSSFKSSFPQNLIEEVS